MILHRRIYLRKRERHVRFRQNKGAIQKRYMLEPTVQSRRQKGVCKAMAYQNPTGTVPANPLSYHQIVIPVVAHRENWPSPRHALACICPIRYMRFVLQEGCQDWIIHPRVDLALRERIKEQPDKSSSVVSIIREQSHGKWERKSH